MDLPSSGKIDREREITFSEVSADIFVTVRDKIEIVTMGDYGHFLNESFQIPLGYGTDKPKCGIIIITIIIARHKGLSKNVIANNLE